MNTPMLADQQKITFISYVRTVDVLLRICQEWGLIINDGELVKEIRAVSTTW